MLKKKKQSNYINDLIDEKEHFEQSINKFYDLLDSQPIYNKINEKSYRKNITDNIIQCKEKIKNINELLENQ